MVYVKCIVKYIFIVYEKQVTKESQSGKPDYRKKMARCENRRKKAQWVI